MALAILEPLTRFSGVLFELLLGGVFFFTIFWICGLSRAFTQGIVCSPGLSGPHERAPESLVLSAKPADGLMVIP